MPLFALPLTASSHPAPVRAHIPLPTRKRKRGGTQLDDDERAFSSSSDDEKFFLNEHEPSQAASTNPLSLTRDEIAQYQLAGLDLDEQLPSTRVKNFPHRPLPEEVFPAPQKERDRKGKGKAGSRSGSRNEVEDDEEVEEREKRRIEDALGKRVREHGPLLRIQHLGVLTAILHRCLQGGDIARASRAWAMLIRAVVGGREIDIRGSGYWGIGAELLVRSHEKVARREQEIDGESEDGWVTKREKRNGANNAPRRWGSAEGLEKVKDYYERLILQYPYRRQFHDAVTALDWWPAMIGCEIYGIQFEQKEGLRKNALVEAEDDNEDMDGSEDSEVAPGDAGVAEDDVFSAEQRRQTRRRQRRAERRWLERDEIRQTALLASERIVGRLDELMTMPPYSDSHVLLRLRGMLALYIGDLKMPALPISHDEDESIKDEERLERARQLGIAGNDSERRLLFRQRLHDHERGKGKREEEQRRARKFFERIISEGGQLGVDIKGLPGGQDNDIQECYDAKE